MDFILISSMCHCLKKKQISQDKINKLGKKHLYFIFYSLAEYLSTFQTGNSLGMNN